MYSLVYQIYFYLKRVQKVRAEQNKEWKGFRKKALDYAEWFFNIPFKRYCEKFPSKKNGLTQKKRKERIILSLTSFPKRIDTVWLTIETLLRQNMKPDKIILWLADSQFEGIDSLPKQLLDQQKRGLTIRFCDDLKSHKKYYYAMQEYPNDIIILADDDILYSKDLVKGLYKLHVKYPEDIVCMSAIKMPEISMKPSRWVQPSHNERLTHTYFAQAYTGAGSLFPPGALDSEYTFRRDLIFELSPSADDLWLKYMSLRNSTKTTVIYKNRYMPVMTYCTADSGLWYLNGLQKQNDVQWQAILFYFKEDSHVERTD